MKQTKNKIIFCAGLLALLTGCFNELSFQPQETTQPETGKVTLSITGTGERTILPETPVFTKYVFSFSPLDDQEGHNDVQVTPDGPVNTTVELQPGYWDITVKGFVSVTGFGDIGIPNGVYQAAEGKVENLQIVIGGAHNISIDLKAGVIPGEKGVLVWDITIPDDAVSAEMEILTIVGKNVETVDLIESPQDKIALDSGYYLIKLSLDGTPLKVEVLHIYGGLTSRIERTLYSSLFRTYRFDDIDALAEFLSMAPANTVDTPYDIVLSGLNVETDFDDGSDPMGKLFSALNGRYVNLDMSACGGVNFQGTSYFNTGKDLICFINLPTGITSIGDYAFIHYKNLTNIELPSGLSSIGNSAFSGCTNLALTSLPEGLTSIGGDSPYGGGAFYGCTKLALTSLPAGLTSTGYETFYGCTNLALTSLPDGLTSIDGGAFYNCTSLALTSLPTGLTSIGNNAFLGCTSLALTSLPAGLTSINYGTFTGCTSLVLTSLPDGINSIGDYAFYGCTSLALTSLPTGLTSIDGISAFSNCTSLALTSLPTGLTSISNSAFSGCTSLALISLPTGITSIDAYTFFNCTNLALVSLPAGLTSIGEYAFYGCTSLALTSLPEGLNSVSSRAFYGCTSLALTSLPAGITSIEGYAFYGCTNLALTSLPAGIISIGDRAFNDCTSLAQITLPAGLISIGEYAFGATQLTSVTFEGSNVSPIGTDAFPGDLDTVYADNGAGTYIRPDTTSTNWTYIGIMFSAANPTQLKDALDAIQVNTTDTRFTIICTEDFNIAPQDLSDADYENKTIALRGDIPMRTIGLSNQGSMFTIGTDVELILEDITLKGRNDNNASLVWINRGSLNMKDNASVFGNINTNSDGGGVYVFYGTFIMQGRASVKENTARNGGGVYSEGGTFTMRDSALVYNNTASETSGGVHVVSSGTFTMLGNASVLENHASSYGGGVGVLGGTFTMLDNTSVLENQTSSYGGGVFLTGGGGTFTMRGNASVSGNTAISSTGSNYGGGVDVSGGTFNMYDSTSVSGNRTTGEGGGVFLSNGTFNMYNSASVFGNKAEDAAIDGNGGGVAVGPNGIFHIVGGIVYGTNESDEDLRNTVSGTNALGAALHISGSGTAERGTFVDDVWVSKGDLLPAGTYYTDNTIKVANGDIVP